MFTINLKLSVITFLASLSLFCGIQAGCVVHDLDSDNPNNNISSWIDSRFMLPFPKGRYYPLGKTVRQIVDIIRLDPHHPEEKRNLFLHIWYPSYRYGREIMLFAPIAKIT